jgi:hypothetical protein
MRLFGTIFNWSLQWGHAVLAALEIQSAFNSQLPSVWRDRYWTRRHGLAGLPAPAF